jgi:hypothetical protein
MLETRRTLGWLRLGACAALPSLMAIPASAVDLGVTLSDSIRPVTHVASGSLYGITETLPTDINGMVAPLKPHALTNPALSGSGRQQPIGAAIPVARRVASLGTKVQIRLPDVLPGWPYKWPGQATWLNEVRNVIAARKASGLTNWDGYEIWNEPPDTWPAANGDFNTLCWKPTYDLLRSQDPGIRIIGPSFSFYSSTRMSDFLKFAKANNCLPDVISWHQWGSSGFVGALENYRALEKSLGITPRAISINEYSSKLSDPYEGSPGYSVPFIAKFERHGVESAMISWWWVALPGRMGSLLTSGNQKGGGWHLYKWYGDMSGYMARTTPPNDKSDGVDAFANVDRAAKFASIVVGGKTTGAVNVKVGGVPSWMGTSVDVKVEQVTWANKDTPVNGPTTLSTSKMNVVNGSFTVPVNVTSEFYGYRVSITPTPSTGVSRTIGLGEYVGETYRVVDLQGRDAGVVDVLAGERLVSAVRRSTQRTGVFLATPAGATGAATRLVVPAR